MAPCRDLPSHVPSAHTWTQTVEPGGERSILVGNDGEISGKLSSGWWCNSHLEKYERNGKDYPIYEMENKTCLRPPTSHGNLNEMLWEI